MNSSLYEILSVPFISQVKMKERIKGPHDTVHISLAASGTGLALWHLLSPLWNHIVCIREHLLLETVSRGKMMPVCAVICSLPHTLWLCACSCLTKQVSGSDLWPAASVLMRTSGISHSIQTSPPLPRKGQIVSTMHWPVPGKLQSWAFIRSGAVEGTKREYERQNSYSIFLSMERQGHVNNQHRGLSAFSVSPGPFFDAASVCLKESITVK